MTSLLDKILRSYSSVEVKIPIHQADALPFQDRIKKPLGINEFRGAAPSHIDSPARRKAFLRISEIVARTESEDHRKDRCQEVPDRPSHHFLFGRLHPSLKIFSQKLFKFILVSRKALISRYAAEHLAV